MLCEVVTVSSGANSELRPDCFSYMEATSCGAFLQGVTSAGCSQWRWPCVFVTIMEMCWEIEAAAALRTQSLVQWIWLVEAFEAERVMTSIMLCHTASAAFPWAAGVQKYCCSHLAMEVCSAPNKLSLVGLFAFSAKSSVIPGRIFLGCHKGWVL